IRIPIESSPEFGHRTADSGSTHPDKPLLVSLYSNRFPASILRFYREVGEKALVFFGNHFVESGQGRGPIRQKLLGALAAGVAVVRLDQAFHSLNIFRFLELLQKDGAAAAIHAGEELSVLVVDES